MVALYTVLSQHAPNEHYLSDADQGLVYVRLPDLALPARPSSQGHGRDRMRQHAAEDMRC